MKYAQLLAAATIKSEKYEQSIKEENARNSEYLKKLDAEIENVTSLDYKKELIEFFNEPL